MSERDLFIAALRRRLKTPDPFRPDERQYRRNREGLGRQQKPIKTLTQNDSRR